MIRKDFIDAEIQKLAQVIAKIIGLKNEGDLDEAIVISQKSLSEDFGFEVSLLEQGSVEEFERLVRAGDYSAEKMSCLGQLLFELAHPFQDTEECVAIVRKTALVFTLLETEYHQQNLENISKRDMINNFLSNEQYE